MPAKVVITLILFVGLFSFSLYPRDTGEQKISEKPQTIFNEVKKEVTSDNTVMAKEEAFIPYEFNIKKLSNRYFIA